MREIRGAQGSDQWLRARIGRITASRISDVMATLKRGGESAARRNYKMELTAERLTRRAADHYVSYEMQRGSEKESDAKMLYEMATGTMLEPVGFVLHPELDFTGASPDALIGEAGVLEVKCPKTETFLEWLDTRQVPEDYICQMQWEMACTGRQFAHFFAFDDRLPAGHQHIVIEVPRNEEMIQRITGEVVRLNTEIEEFIARNGYPPTQWTVELAEDSPEEDEGDYLDSLTSAVAGEFIP